METWNKPQIIDDCISQMEIDIMPFHDVFRSIYGFDIPVPHQAQLNSTYELISHLITHKNIITVFGPEMKPSGKSQDIDLCRIKKTIDSKKYEDYNYGIWFDFLENWKKK